MASISHKPLTIGLELEATKLTPQTALLTGRHGVMRTRDGTLTDHRGVRLPEHIGGELISPIMQATVSCAEDGRNLRLGSLDAMYATVQAMCGCAAEVNVSCGIHLHLGRPSKEDLNKSAWRPEEVRTWLLIGALLEDKLFAVVPASRHRNKFCAPIREAYSTEDMTTFYPMGEVLPNKRENPKRYCWLNTIETRRVGTRDSRRFGAGPALGTVEIRLLGNTRRFDYIWAWVQLWLKVSALVAYVPSSLAVMHATVGKTLEADLANLAALKVQGMPDEAAPTPAHASSTLPAFSVEEGE